MTPLVPPVPGGAVVLGVGVDLVEVSRMAAALDRRVFPLRWFSAGELSHAQRGSRPAEALAGCWAAREAWAKASGLALSLCATGVRVAHLGDGAPYLELSDAVSRHASGAAARALVSISHDGGVAAAVALCLAQTATDPTRD